MIGLADLEGRWRVRRRIEDALAGLEGRFEGICDWIPGADGLRQSEAGILTYGQAPPMKAERTYFWCCRAGHLEVRFDDGRFFHSFDQKLSKPQADHLCGEDFYEVAYDFSNWPRWSSRWKVTGPRKDLVISSWFEREG